MKESRLTPFDAELLVMIGDIAKRQPEVEENPDRYEITVDTTEIQGKSIEALKQAVAGRLGERLLVTHTLAAAVVFNVEYDPTEYPEQIRTRLVEPDATAGTRYCRTLLEVDAIQVLRDNVDDLLRFTGGGTMTTPKTPDGRAVYTFADGNGIFIDAPESWFIVREPNGRMIARPERDFNREFEPKGIRTVGNNNEKPASPSGSEFMETFNRLFGTDIDSRNRKLSEEYGEYMEAANAFIRNPDDRALFDAMVDELGDLNAVVSHIAGIVGKTPYELLQSAYDKVVGRQTDPMYKRKHPHGVSPCKFDPENIGECGNCENMQFEDANGDGYCDTIKDNTRCDEKACGHYKPKN